MDKEYNKLGIFSGSTLKVIACIFMVIDHVGLTFFSDLDIFRTLGRLSFPIFAFFIAEGSRYSKHKLRRFCSIFSIGLTFFLFYIVYDGQIYGNIFLTFSLSILLDYLLYSCKKIILTKKNVIYRIILPIGYASILVLVYCLCEIMHFEYGFFGMLLPIIINLTNFKGIEAGEALKKTDNHWVRILLMSIGLILLSIDGNLGVIQYYCLLSLIPLAFYNGKVGCRKLKYMFYVFYPAHLAIIEIIAIIINNFT